jgi:hypothetical protein
MFLLSSFPSTNAGNCFFGSAGSCRGMSVHSSCVGIYDEVPCYCQDLLARVKYTSKRLLGCPFVSHHLLPKVDLMKGPTCPFFRGQKERRWMRKHVAKDRCYLFLRWYELARRAPVN